MSTAHRSIASAASPKNISPGYQLVTVSFAFAAQSFGAHTAIFLISLRSEAVAAQETFPFLRARGFVSFTGFAFTVSS